MSLNLDCGGCNDRDVEIAALRKEVGEAKEELRLSRIHGDDARRARSVLDNVASLNTINKVCTEREAAESAASALRDRVAALEGAFERDKLAEAICSSEYGTMAWGAGTAWARERYRKRADYIRDWFRALLSPAPEKPAEPKTEACGTCGGGGFVHPTGRRFEGNECVRVTARPCPACQPKEPR